MSAENDLQETRDACRDFVVAYEAYVDATGYHGPPADYTPVTKELRRTHRKVRILLNRNSERVPQELLDRIDNSRNRIKKLEKKTHTHSQFEERLADLEGRIDEQVGDL